MIQEKFRYTCISISKMEGKEILSIRWFNYKFCIYRVNNSCFLLYVDYGEIRRTMAKI